ncbi:MAG: Gfo/Idh/MocA family oxidoreductase [Chloroflexia bacterium]
MPNLHADWEALLARDDLDVVSVCVPNSLHAPVTIRALETGRHVLCEKPLARTAAEAEAMVAAAVENGRVLHTAFNHRERGDIAVLKEFIDAGKLGRVYQAKASWMRYNGIPGRARGSRTRTCRGGPLMTSASTCSTRRST